jgi:hypothetical protein
MNYTMTRIYLLLYLKCSLGPSMYIQASIKYCFCNAICFKANADESLSHAEFHKVDNSLNNFLQITIPLKAGV